MKIWEEYIESLNEEELHKELIKYKKNLITKSYLYYDQRQEDERKLLHIDEKLNSIKNQIHYSTINS